MNEMEWSCIGSGKLDIPKEKLAKQAYRWTSPKPVNLMGTCAYWEFENGMTTLKDVFIDTSEKVDGVTLMSRVTHRTEMVITQAIVIIFSLEQIEK